MPIGRYRIMHPTIALFHEDGHHVAHTVPEGATVKVDSAAFDGDKLVDVTWDGKKVHPGLAVADGSHRRSP